MYSQSRYVFAILLCLSQLIFGVVRAAPVSFSSGYQVESLGYFSGSMDFAASSSTNASLTLILDNLSSTASGGKIVGVALNLPFVSGSSITGLSFTGPNTNFVSLGLTDNDVNASPLGYFDFGSSTVSGVGMGSASWQNGFPNAGIAVNSSGTFTFTFTGSNLGALSTLDFINAVAPGNTQGPSQFIAVRFQGFDGVNAGRSDKVGGFIPSSPPTVPVPASAWLLLSGLGSMGVLARKKKSV
jgi:hypothetical protein